VRLAARGKCSSRLLNHRMTSILSSNWRRWRHIVFVTCPGCGVEGRLQHDVSDDGKVSPSLDCPSCSFHEWVKLEGWKLE
jgi:hypothetical protein